MQLKIPEVYLTARDVNGARIVDALSDIASVDQRLRDIGWFKQPVDLNDDEFDNDLCAFGFSPDQTHAKASLTAFQRFLNRHAAHVTVEKLVLQAWYMSVRCIDQPVAGLLLHWSRAEALNVRKATSTKAMPLAREARV